MPTTAAKNTHAPDFEDKILWEQRLSRMATVAWEQLATRLPRIATRLRELQSQGYIACCTLHADGGRENYLRVPDNGYEVLTWFCNAPVYGLTITTDPDGATPDQVIPSSVCWVVYRVMHVL